MKDLNVLLMCALGASSGFMAAHIRKAAVKRGLNVKVTARSESELEDYIDGCDAVMIGPHLKYAADEITEKVKNSETKVIVMKPEYYSTLNGDQALDHLLSYFE
ncbi:PTS sugar transporter subunit IIB [Caproiciproducens sp. R1]|jgi:Phosphotransferase system cellobiose-specific component IIB|uniref:PTS sugar transporter subunit IIB n=1 Tax=Caproiciproducens sp. R1 TaxID=3435000 RepID=UPI00056DE1B6|nr:PTS sugar transporter subunit IIB [Oscillospiraceae bacterium]